MKTFIIKLYGDLKNIFIYPKCDYGDDLGLDYGRYWKRRRGGNDSVFSSWQKQRADIVISLVKPGSTVLDIGCGDGSILKYLKEKANISGIGIDVDQSVLDRANQLGIKTIKIDVNKISELQSLPTVDYILGFEIIEHMPNPEKIIHYLSEKTRNGFIFSTPNTGYYTHRLRLFFGKFPLQWVVHPGEHIRFWTVTDLKFWVKSLNFSLNKIVLYEGLPFLNKILPKLFSMGMVFYISKVK